MTLTRVRIHSDRYVEVLEKVTDAAGAKGWTLQVCESIATMKAPGDDGHVLICDRILLRLSRD